MSQPTSRKQFFAKLAGAAASAAVLPKLLAKSASAPAAAAPASPIQVRPETRAIARRADSI